MAEFDQVAVCHPDVVDPLETMIPPELSILRHTGPGEGAVSGRFGPPFAFPPPEDFPSLHNRPWENIDPEEQDVPIGHSLQCEDTKMVVSIEKEILKVSKDPFA